ncbi:MAG: AraC family transcriptional regulator [Planctomycetaceae bacterium]|nr:AraC family transcriptional regulator [Planctomycetaceae bacterium]
MVKTTLNSRDFQDQFFNQLAAPRELLTLFDFIPGVYMYIKDVDSRFVRANRVVCDVVGAADPDELVGKTDFDFFPPAIASQYVAEDERVIASRQALSNQVWMVPGRNGVPRLYLCNKIPLLDAAEAVVGIAGVKRPYEFSASDSAGYGRLTRAIAYVTENYHREIEVGDIAEHVSLSISQLQREFSANFSITPVRYLREVRIGVARHLLESSDQSLAQIATDCGFYDQSHLTRHFKASTGLTPMKYRNRFRDDQTSSSD